MTNKTLRGLLACALVPGCVASDESFGTETSDINLGTPIPPNNSGMILVTSNAGGCSGTLMTNDWVLTARHCFTQTEVNAPWTVSLTMGSQALWGAEIQLDPNADVALIRSAVPFAMNGSWTNFQTLLTPLDKNTLASGELLTCKGYGESTLNTGIGFGVLRTANLPVHGPDALTTLLGFDLSLNANSAGQFLDHGDSGGSCIKVLPTGETVVVGVTSEIYTGPGGPIDDLVSVQNFRSWYAGTVTPSADIIQQWGWPGDIPLAMDWDNDGYSDYVVWRPSTGTWFVKNFVTGATFSKQWGQPGDIPLRADFDHDGRPDLVVWRPSIGEWFVILSSTGATMTRMWGQQGDIPVPADFDGDGKTDFAVWRPSTGVWFVIDSSTGGVTTQQWGQPGDVPVAADFDGDGKADFAVWRPSTGIWFVINSSTHGVTTQQWGLFGDTPSTAFLRCHAPNAWGPTVWRPWSGAWFVQDRPAPLLGQPGDVPVAANYDGPAYPGPDFAIWRPSNGTWYVQLNPTGC